jgi:transcription antitermination factor NusG
MIEHVGQNSARHWFAVQTRSRHEKVVRDRLVGDGFEPLLPLIARLSQWTDRKKTIEVPLFSGYCFAQFSLEERSTVLRAPGVVRVVGTAASPEPITEEEIAAIKKLSDSSLPYGTHPYLVEGMPVEVIRGPLAGVKGQLIRKAGHSQLIIRIHLIQQAAAVHIDAADLIPIERRARLDGARLYLTTRLQHVGQGDT